ncbi:MAG: YkvA family protein [Terriglobia bacterium]
MPDFIPVLGHLDDVIIVPLLLGCALQLVPAEVAREHRAPSFSSRDGG